MGFVIYLMIDDKNAVYIDILFAFSISSSVKSMVIFIDDSSDVFGYILTVQFIFFQYLLQRFFY